MLTPLRIVAVLIRYRFYTFHLQISFILFLLYLMNSGCSPPDKPPPQLLKDSKTRLTFSPPQVVEAGKPNVVYLDTCPAPEKFPILNSSSAGKTRITENGKHTTLLPPVKKKAGFFIQMPSYNSEQGLSSNQVFSGYIDKSGTIWLGTSRGISRFDGKIFTNYSTDHGLVNQAVASILEDKNGNMWFSTGAGAACFNGHCFINYDTSQGLVGNDVMEIIEDSKGNLWFGTHAGASRFDGKTFTNFTKADGLAGNDVDGISEDRKGRLWFTTEDGGVSCYDGKTFVTYTVNDGLSSNATIKSVEDNQGNMWFTTRGSGVSKFDGKTFTNFSKADGLPSNYTQSIIKDKNGNLWFGTEARGVSCFNGKTFTNYNTDQGLANFNVNDIREDRNGNLWFFHNEGSVSVFSGESFLNYGTAQGLASNIVWSIAEDKKGNLWFGTAGGGVSCYDGNRMEELHKCDSATKKLQTDYTEINGHPFKSFTNYTTQQGLGNDGIYGINTDSKGNVWIATCFGGLSRFDGKTITNFTTRQGLGNDLALCVKEDKKGNLWIGTKGGVSCYDGKCFKTYTKEQGLLCESVWSILEDHKGNLWFSSTGNGVTCFDGKTFRHFSTEQGLPDNYVSSLAEDSYGNIWFTTIQGLSRYDGSAFLNFTTKNGLPSNVTTQVLTDDEHHLIVGTEFGIAILTGFSSDAGTASHVSPENALSNEKLRTLHPDFEIYNAFGGYPIKGVNAQYHAMYKDKTGKIWIGSNSEKTSLVCFNYKKLHKHTLAPNALIHALKINNESLCWNLLKKEEDPGKYKILQASLMNEEVGTFGHLLTGVQQDSIIQKFDGVRFDSLSPFYPVPVGLQLPYHLNNITIHFSAVEPTRPYLVRYRYKLEGYDKDWSPVTDKSFTSFGNIDEGTYIFFLEARIASGPWSSPLIYRFTVLPPWYRTWWAYLLYSIAAAFIILLVVRMRTQSLLKDKRLLEQTVRERTQEYMDQKIKAEELAKAKENFLSNMSHEIRTPLNAIIGYTDLNLLEDVSYPIRRNLQAVKTSSLHLRRLIDDILDYSKIEAGKLSLYETAFNLRQLLPSIRQLLLFMAQQKNNSIFIHIPDSVPDLFYGDKERLMQVLINLLDNAIKFTDNGTINISVDSRETENKKFELTFTVADTGIGIPSDKLLNIFESFIQVDDSISKKYGGSGLGLAISKRIIELQGGSITVTSTPNKGTSFTFQLTYTTIPPESASSEMVIQGMHSGEHLCFAAVEDDPVNQDILRQMMMKLNIKIDIVKTGKELFTLLQLHSYDLILMDIHLPEMNGFEIARLVREQVKPDQPIPIIALTADVMPETRTKMSAAGINDYIYKPIDLEKLRFKIIETLHLKHDSLPVIQTRIVYEIQPQYFNLSYLSEVYGGNKEEVLRMLTTSLDKLNEYIVLLEKAFHARQQKEIHFIAHKLITIVAILGITDARPRLLEVQQTILFHEQVQLIPEMLLYLKDISHMVSHELATLKFNFQQKQML